MLFLGGCGWWGGDNRGAPQTLPPIQTTAPTTTLPPATTTTVPTEYIVQKGDSLIRIAQQFGVTVAQLVAANNIANADQIQEGQRLTIPPPTTVAGATTTTKPAAPAAPTTAHS
jgi:LysM repeat protein